MNIALPAIVIFFILYSGFLARARFMLIKHQSLDYSPFGKAVAEAVILAVFLHVLWIYITAELFHTTLDVNSFLNLLTSDSNAQTNSITAIAQNWQSVALYFLTLNITCLIIPPAIQSLISTYRLDSLSNPWLSRFFRFKDADWYYLLNGNDELNEPELVVVSAIVQVDNKATLYIGNIYDYAMDKNGTLDYLLLRNVSRWNLKEYEDAKNVQEILNAAFPIKGKNFVLRYSETITLSINYLNLSDASIVHNE